MTTLNQAKQEAKQTAARAVRPWISNVGKAGYMAKGVVYFVIGILALRAAMGISSTTVNQQDALVAIARQPYGQVLLAIVMIGLLAYVVWRVVEAIFDPLNVGQKLKGIAERIGYLVSAAGYLLLTFAAYRMLKSGMAASTQGGQTQSMTASLMAKPAGQILVGLIGVIMIVVGLVQLRQAFTSKFKERYHMSRMSASTKSLTINTGRLGMAARSIVYFIIGYFFIQAAYTYNPSKASGLGGAFTALMQQPYGPYLLGAVALGLMLYGVYAFLLGRYGRFAI